MTFTVQRERTHGNALLGQFLLDGHPFAFTVENNERRIPAGVYPLTLKYSPKNQRIVPWLEDVPDRECVEVHPANWPKELDGCIAPGLESWPDGVGHSIAAFETLMKVLRPLFRTNGPGASLEVKDPCTDS